MVLLQVGTVIPTYDAIYSLVVHIFTFHFAQTFREI
jgi:hypothetical protein